MMDVKALSGNNIGNINSNNTDIFGIGKAIEAFFDYKKLKITVTQQNIEPLHHLIRKDILTTQPKTKDFIDKIFKLYEKGDVKISMVTLRVIEYMDDELLEAIEHLRGKIKLHVGRDVVVNRVKLLPQFRRDPACERYAVMLRNHNLISHRDHNLMFGGGTIDGNGDSSDENFECYSSVIYAILSLAQ